MKDHRLEFIVIGLPFSLLWASAAGKFGLRSAEPLSFFTYRFLAEGIIMIVFAYAIMRYRMYIGQSKK